ncbi:MAG: iron complex transport system substrate-binding protein [Planctomycetota bacterium]
MSKNSFLLCASLAVGLGAVSCSKERVWDAADWRPQQPAQRIVAGSVLAVESLLEVIPHERLVGVHTIAADARYSLVADQAKSLPLLGASPEQLLSVRPDLVLVDAFTRAETLALLAAANVPVVRTRDPHSFEDIEANLRLLGRVTHLDDDVEQIIAATTTKLEAVRLAGKDLTTWRLLSLDGALHTYGEGSLFDVMTRTAGARNLAAEQGVGAFRKLDIEEVLAWRPDALVLSGEPPTGGGLPEWVKQCPGLDLLPCVAAGRILYVPARLLITTSHRLVDSAAFVQKQLLEWGKP